MKAVVLRGQKVVSGVAAGEALVCSEPISFIGGVDPLTGLVTEKGHQLEGRCVAGKVLLYPTGKGSTGGSYRLYEMAYRGTAPAVILLAEREPVVTVGCIMAGIPCVDRIEPNPFQTVRDGDRVEVDARTGAVIVIR